MMNPVFQYPPEKRRKNRTEKDEELFALAGQPNAKPAKVPSTRKNIGLWAGNLLIRMGKKLAEQDIDLKTSKEHA